ncbi:hypothetical protein QYF36_019020 [Acer negundo]|nr:hypothetical protein QYF36_019020 [Acer negundo]
MGLGFMIQKLLTRTDSEENKWSLPSCRIAAVLSPYCRHRAAVLPPSLPVSTSRFRRTFSPPHPGLRETHIQSFCAELQGET